MSEPRFHLGFHRHHLRGGAPGNRTQRDHKGHQVYSLIRLHNGLSLRISNPRNAEGRFDFRLGGLLNIPGMGTLGAARISFILRGLAASGDHKQACQTSDIRETLLMARTLGLRRFRRPERQGGGH